MGPLLRAPIILVYIESVHELECFTLELLPKLFDQNGQACQSWAIKENSDGINFEVESSPEYCQFLYFDFNQLGVEIVEA